MQSAYATPEPMPCSWARRRCATQASSRGWRLCRRDAHVLGRFANAGSSGALERETEAGAVSWLALDVHGPSVRFDEAAGDGQPESCARRVVGTGSGLFAAERAFEDSGQVLGGDALARVGYLDAHHASFRRRAEGHGAVKRGVAQGVGDEVVEHALQPRRVREHRVYLAGDLPEQAYASSIRLRLEARDGVGDQVVQRGLFEA